MNIFDRAIATVAPIYGAKRAAARLALRAYDGAAIGKRRTGFGKVGGSANTGIGLDLGRLRDRASAQVRNNPHAHAIVDVSVRHIIGAGITPRWNTGSDRLDRQVTLLWEEWVQDADVEGELDAYGQQAALTRAMVERGESLYRTIYLPRRSDAPRVPVRMQMLEGDHIDTAREGNNIDGRRARLGVALGDHNRRQGYFLFPEHPGENISVAASRFVDREYVQHVYRPLRIGQVRGVTWLAPLLLATKDLQDLLQFVIVKHQVEASFAGFVTSTSGMQTPIAGQTRPDAGDRRMMPEPGTLFELQSGQDIKFPSLSSSNQFEAVAVHVLQAMAVGAGLTYDQVTGDLRRANYSSLRAGKIEHRRFIEQVQWHHVIPRICRRQADTFVNAAILSGALRPRAEGYPRDWVPPANEPIDPKKDLEADIAAVRAGRMSPQEFIAQWGRDWRKVVNDTAEFWKAADAKKLALDIDPRRPLAGAAKGAVTEKSDDEDPAGASRPDDEDEDQDQ